MIKLVLTDMDGTLLNRAGQLPEGLDATVQELKKRNIIFGAASGRQYYSLRETFKAYQDEMLFVAENGTYVMYQNKEIFSNPMERAHLEEILAIAGRIPDVHLLVSGKKQAYYKSVNERFLKQVGLYYKRVQRVDDFHEIEDDILKIALFDLKGAETNSYPFFLPLSDHLQVAVSADCWLDLMKMGATKGEAVQHIQSVMGIGFDETVVFGDYMNDLEMMSAAYYSFAMENAHETVKNAARFMAKSNEERGVLLAIEETVLQDRGK